MKRSGNIRHLAILMAMILATICGPSNGADKQVPPTNKLLYMYQFYYLPFSLQFHVGKKSNDILPFFPEVYPNPTRILTAEELKVLDSQWIAIKKKWAKKSLLENTKVPVGQTIHISQRIISHHIDLKRNALTNLSINEQIQAKQAIKGKDAAARAAFKQEQYLKSFLKPLEMEKFNFFVVGASWCNSSREYRVLFESYFKKFPNPAVNLHSVVIEDPEEKVFSSRLLQELFPNKNKYSHNSIPRFLAIQTVNGKTTVWEEGDALKQLFVRHFQPHLGYLNQSTTLLKAIPSKRKLASDPYFSSVK